MAFTLAAGVGAVALAVIFGVQHLSAASLIFASAAAVGHCAAAWPSTARTSSCSHSVQRCSLALLVRWLFGFS